MKVTKLEHAAFTVEEAGAALIVDPGSYLTGADGLTGIVAVVITHEHADHWTEEQLVRIRGRNPRAEVFAPASVAALASDVGIRTIAAGDEIDVGPFALQFFGERHAVVHRSIPVIDNVGVLINQTCYYAGDSFTVPESREIGILAVPASAPWLKIGEVMDYVAEIGPRCSFPVHEMALSESGKQSAYARIRKATEQFGGRFFPLEPRETLTF